MSGTRRILVVALVAGAAVCVAVTAPWQSTVDTQVAVAVPAVSSPVPPPRALVAPSASVPAQPSCDTLIAGLSPRDRVAQLVMAGANPGDERQASALVTGDHVGGIFVGGTATRLLTGARLAAIQASSRIPVFVAVDEEGGRVQRIDALDGPLPSARSLATRPPAEVTSLGARRGRQLAARGVTMDLAPVVDVTAGPASSVIGDRSFSADPAVVARYAGAFADGLRSSGIVPVLKHFPGHGRADGDSHRGLVRTPGLSSLSTDDLVPYADLVPRGIPAVMLGHLDVPGLTDGAPASLSPAAYRLLREKYGFSGVAMTDDLGAMRAVTSRYPLPEAVLLALRSGADVALWSAPSPPGPVLDRLVRALSSGELPSSRVVSALTHVLHLKTGCR